MYGKRILAYTEIIDYKVYMNCKYRFRVISGSHILHLPVKSVIVGIKVHYIFDISFKSFHCLFLLSLSYGCIIRQVDLYFLPNRKKKQTNLAKKERYCSAIMKHRWMTGIYCLSFTARIPD